MRAVRNWILSLAAVVAMASGANAAAIDSFSPTWSGGTLSSGGLTISYGTGQLGDQAPTDPYLNTTSLTSLVLSNPTAGGNGLVTVGPTFTVGGGSGAVFTFIGPLSISNYEEVGIASFDISGQAYVRFDSNFGAEGRIFDFTATFNGLRVDSNGLFVIPATTSVSATFTGTDDVFDFPQEEVPEPATLATFGLMGLLGGSVLRRKMKTAPVAQA